MKHRHELTDEQWTRLQPLLPRPKRGPQPRDRRRLLNGILWILSTGAQWRDLPERYGPWETVYGHFHSLRTSGVFDRILDALHLRLDQEGRIDWDLWCIDGTSVRATRSAAGATKKALNSIPTSPKTMRWAAREADLAANSHSSRMAKAHRSK